jgi:glycosyltransferase involved in cell wall biosynthesis
MKVLFVNYQHLDTNSGIHIFNLANHLTRLGVECTVCVPKKKEMVLALGEALFEVVNIKDIYRLKTKINVDLIHVWTPREVVRKITQELLGIYSCPFIVHLEDNEEFMTEVFTGFPLHILKHFPAFLLNLVIPSRLSHPIRYKEFLANAGGITVNIESLKKFCPINVPNETIWAGYQEDLQWDMPVDLEFKHRLGITNSELMVVYTGNVHLVNRQEVASLYQAIWLIRQRGFPVKLIRTGKDFVSFLDGGLNRHKKDYCLELGHLPRRNLPSVLSIADILIQPGIPDQFNNYRFPSKLPEYLASGKPVILPKANIGLYLKDKEECLLLEKGDAFDIAEKLELLLLNEPLRNKIGAGGRKFAEEHLKWGNIASKLQSFYFSLLHKTN